MWDEEGQRGHRRGGQAEVMGDASSSSTVFKRRQLISHRTKSSAGERKRVGFVVIGPSDGSLSSVTYCDAEQTLKRVIITVLNVSITFRCACLW